MPTLTVVVPTYRRLGYLTEALASVRAQTLTDIEVLVCDNADDPATRRLVTELGDPRVVYVPRPRDLGLARNALLGLASAASPLVTKLDDDDAMEPRTLALLAAAFARHPRIDVAFGRLRLVDHDGNDLAARTSALDRHSGRALMPEGLVHGLDAVIGSGAMNLACAVFRREILDDPVPDAVSTAYDLHLLLRLAARGAPGWYAPGAVTRYRLHPDSDTNTGAVRQGLGALAAYDLAEREARHDLRRRPDLLATARTHVAVRTARGLIRAGETGRARQVLLQDLRHHPTAAAARLTLGTFAPSSLAARVSRARGAAWERREAAHDLTDA
ncbi:glycosyltransferase family 2 protein [Mobilicoccus sp.]|uniref:glycosyltransferase family 2 protein n=1 Tax=Mobilicoccus sp. TaxID=2034349 RepID=UPI0028A5F45E|nr:glycosyltransferase family 2 protein [Mobilicoccus sp.]